MMKKVLLAIVALAFLAVGATDAEARRGAAKKKKPGAVETIVIEPSV